MAAESSHSSSAHPRHRWLMRLGAVAATGGIAVATLALTAPAASARIKESTIRGECRAAGGTYNSYIVEGQGLAPDFRYTTCRYRDIDGDVYTDYYADGEYNGTSP
jgi:hypothetical protein